MAQSQTIPSQSRIVVAKFGGSSVATAERWQRIASIIESHLRAGARPVAVCSALRGVSDLLTQVADRLETGGDPAEPLGDILARHRALAAKLNVDFDEVLGDLAAGLTDRVAAIGASGEAPTPRDRAWIMSHGELMSTRMGAAFLNDSGLPTAWVDARNLLSEAEACASLPDAHRYLSSHCEPGPTEEAAAALDRAGAPVIITQGFIARSCDGDTVLLGRGGSDTSAAYIASRLEADRLEIWSDVPGLFTANPYAHDKARLLRVATYRETSVLAALGGRVLHPRTLEPLREQGIPLRLGWTDHPEVAGTFIGPTQNGYDAAKAITSRRGLCLVRMQREPTWQPVGFMAEVSACFKRHGLSMDLVASSSGDIRATIDLAAFPGAEERLDNLVSELERFCTPTVLRDVASVSLVGHGVSRGFHRLDFLLESLRGLRIHMVSHGADDCHHTYVVDGGDAERLIEMLHDRLVDSIDSAPFLGSTLAELRGEPEAAGDAAAA